MIIHMYGDLFDFNLLFPKLPDYWWLFDNMHNEKNKIAWFFQFELLPTCLSNKSKKSQENCILLGILVLTWCVCNWTILLIVHAID